uniref:hypothetical protein n=1 Tax=Stenotrophomonas maltophilia TaxID=40324 RepID=UPI0013D93DDF
DTLDGGLGNDTLDGGMGNDTAVYGKTQASYAISKSGDATLIRDLTTGEVDTLRLMEFAQFSDTTFVIA